MICSSDVLLSHGNRIQHLGCFFFACNCLATHQLCFSSFAQSQHLLVADAFILSCLWNLTLFLSEHIMTSKIRFVVKYCKSIASNLSPKWDYKSLYLKTDQQQLNDVWLSMRCHAIQWHAYIRVHAPVRSFIHSLAWTTHTHTNRH